MRVNAVEARNKRSSQQFPFVVLGAAHECMGERTRAWVRFDVAAKE